MIPPTGSKYTTSILLRPWLWLGVVFYFLDVMPMFCPYPTSCIWYDIKKAGVPFCVLPKCPYRLTAKSMLEQEIALLEGIKRKSEVQKAVIARLRQKYLQEFGREKNE